ncbi:MAG TPA: exopolyphosphatase [Thiotrichales bacterium]|nr:exopolyphosphatase [Thiotrichales bacterium]
MAAVDLGSNSFHMLVVQVEDGEVRVVDKLREMVRLGAGLDEQNRIRPDAQQRALACLERFGQRLRGIPPANVRIVGTNTLRKARGAGDFIMEAQRVLGHPIEIISGIEEARLIYLGVAHSMPPRSGRRLVVDIGGGSTEVIIGLDFEPLELESLYMGCVSMSQRFFPGGEIRKSAMQQARVAALLELEGVVRRFRELGWVQSIGASGTAKALRKVAEAEGWSRDGISAQALKKMRKTLLAARHIDQVELKGLSEERRPVFAGGLMVMSALFEALGIEHMEVSDGALREGVIYDQIGRRRGDIRERSVRSLCRRYQVDMEHAERVRGVAQRLMAQVSDCWRLHPEECAGLLGWAALLHEAGLAIAHSQYHRHGAYIAGNSDMPGFSHTEQQVLAALIRGHRRKFPGSVFHALPPDRAGRAERLCILLRIAVALCRSRSTRPLPEIGVECGPDSLFLRFPPGWLEERALTAADLEMEARYLDAIGVELRFA